MLKLEIKKCQRQIEKEERILKIITIKEKKLLNHFISRVEELKNVCASKQIFYIWEI